jgi:hypothetical protein
MKISDLKKGYAGMNAGMWVDGIPLPLYAGVRLKVRRLWNPDYAALHDKLSEVSSDLSADANEKRITDECLLGACLLDWGGLDDAFSADVARDLLADAEAGPAFRSALIYAAAHVADQVVAQLEADAKN